MCLINLGFCTVIRLINLGYCTIMCLINLGYCTICVSTQSQSTQLKLRVLCPVLLRLLVRGTAVYMIQFLHWNSCSVT